MPQRPGGRQSATAGEQETGGLTGTSRHAECACFVAAGVSSMRRLVALCCSSLDHLSSWMEEFDALLEASRKRPSQQSSNRMRADAVRLALVITISGVQRFDGLPSSALDREISSC
jgi:hypothetical protein